MYARMLKYFFLYFLNNNKNENDVKSDDNHDKDKV